MGGLIAGLPVGLGPGFYFPMQYNNNINNYDKATAGKANQPQ